MRPDSDKTAKELTNQLEKQLAKAPFIARMGNDIYYLYYFQTRDNDFDLWNKRHETLNVI